MTPTEAKAAATLARLALCNQGCHQWHGYKCRDCEVRKSLYIARPKESK